MGVKRRGGEVLYPKSKKAPRATVPRRARGNEE